MPKPASAVLAPQISWPLPLTVSSVPACASEAPAHKVAPRRPAKNLIMVGLDSRIGACPVGKRLMSLQAARARGWLHRAPEDITSSFRTAVKCKRDERRLLPACG